MAVPLTNGASVPTPQSSIMAPCVLLRRHASTRATAGGDGRRAPARRVGYDKETDFMDWLPCAAATARSTGRTTAPGIDPRLQPRRRRLRHGARGLVTPSRTYFDRDAATPGSPTTSATRTPTASPNWDETHGRMLPTWWTAVQRSRRRSGSPYRHRARRRRLRRRRRARRRRRPGPRRHPEHRGAEPQRGRRPPRLRRRPNPTRPRATRSPIVRARAAVQPLRAVHRTRAPARATSRSRDHGRPFDG